MRFCGFHGAVVLFSIVFTMPSYADGGRDSGARDSATTDAPSAAGGSTSAEGSLGSGGASGGSGGASTGGATAASGGASTKTDAQGDAPPPDSSTREGGAGQPLTGSSAVSCGPVAGGLDAQALPSCTDICSMGSCVPSTQLPDQGAGFPSCPSGTDRCVPRFLIETLGLVRFKSCHSVGSTEGRCLPTCLPIVAGQLLGVPQDDCLDTERCIPCYNPVTGADNGVCQYACDPGPQREPFLFPGCCGSDGVCLASDLLGPSDRARLQKESCGANELCAPKDPATLSFACEVLGSEPGLPPTGSGGAPGSGGGGASSEKDGGKTSGAASSQDDSGCGCRVGGRESGPSGSWWFGAVGIVALVRRRRVIR